MAGFLVVAGLNYYSQDADVVKWKNFYITLAVGALVAVLVVFAGAVAVDGFRQSIKAVAATDELTGMPNRGAFFHQAQRDVVQAGRYNTPVSLLIIDVDNFKKVNDKLGHQTGDLVLKELADRIRITVRENDLAGRIGGEEFGVILPQTDLDSACAAGRRVQKAVAESRLAASGFGIDITLSIGAACRKNAYTDLNELMRMADLALYEAKKLGGNRICTMHEKT
jgi:diguanylate cyclase (GGDEF)-like protein